MKNLNFGIVLLAFLLTGKVAGATLMTANWSAQVQRLEGIATESVFEVGDTITWSVTYNDDFFTDFLGVYDPFIFRSFEILGTTYDHKLSQWFAEVDYLEPVRNILSIYIDSTVGSIGGVEYHAGQGDYAMEGFLTGGVGGFFRIRDSALQSICFNTSSVTFTKVPGVYAAVPEPTSILLVGVGIVGFVGHRRRQKKE